MRDNPPAMPITQLEHFLVLTDDVDRTRDFYRDVLGLSVGPRPPLAFAGYWLYAGSTPCVHIGERAGYALYSAPLGIPVSPAADGTGPFDHVAFNATDFEAMSARLAQHGVTAHVNVVPGIGLKQLFFYDPNGVKIEINISAQPPAKA
jgi:catechol 2,3-dioxygenase-like lactoylglutathione lyase family enzyme